MIKIDKHVIAARKQQLDEVKTALKSQFIGIDDIIDNLLDYIQVWYLMPEILTRPIIINLWGMTGVGKTDLIRKMVKYLNYQDRFTEVELSNTDETSWERSVSSILENQGFHDEKPCIVLFDEIQRFNTIDTDGRPLPQTKFMDFWELLSDGFLSRKYKADLDYYITNFMSRQKDIQKRKARGEEVAEEESNISYWDAQSLKKNLNLDMQVDDIIDLTERDMVDMIMGAKKKKAIYEPINHSKTLIIISGNLDDAFQMALQTSEADIDADIFHAYTQKITLVDVKNALTRKFRPEQVARFGNIHLIYKSLRKTDFELLIQREIDRIIRETRDKIGIALEVDESINTLIYRNGVFPVQGVRPVFSSVIDILDANISNLVFNAIMNDETKIKVKYDEKTKEIVAKIGKKREERIAYVGRIDRIRESNIKDTVANISVHEAGHAVVYMVLTKMAPLQLKSKIASSYAGGFTFPHQIHETKENIIAKIKIFLAGGIAEEIIFGDNNASVGRNNDREQATTLALDYIRRYGFDERFQANYTLEYGYKMQKNVTDKDTEKMLATLVKETQELLNDHKPLLMALSKALYKKGSMEAAEVAAIAQLFDVTAHIKSEGFLYINNYQAQLEQ